MSVGTLTIQTTVSGVASAAGAKTVTDNDAIIANPTSVLVAQAGTLTTRANNTSGTLTMGSNTHGIITGQRFDLFWDAGNSVVAGSCYGIPAGTVNGAIIPFVSVAGGDALPLANTTIQAGIAQSMPFPVTGNNVTCLMMSGLSCRSRFAFVSGSELASFLVESSQVYFWNGTGTNPLLGVAPNNVWISHNDITVAKSALQAVALTH